MYMSRVPARANGLGADAAKRGWQAGAQRRHRVGMSSAGAGVKCLVGVSGVDWASCTENMLVAARMK